MAIRLNAVFAAAAIVLIAAMWLLGWNDILSGIIPILLIHFGMTTLILGWKWREGDAPHCAKCNHQVPPGPYRPPRCPECGTAWKGTDDFVEGRVHRSPLMIWSGVGLFLCAALLLGNTIVSYSMPALKWKSAPLLLLEREIAHPDVHIHEDGFSALANRQLTIDDERRLVEALLDRRRAGGVVPATCTTWLEKTLAGPSGRTDLTDRYYRDSAIAELIVPEQVKISEPFDVSLQVAQTYWYSPNESLEAWATAIRVGDLDSPPVVEPLEVVGGSGFGSAIELERAMYNWTIPRAPDLPGPTSVNVELLYVALPSAVVGGNPAYVVNGKLQLHPAAKCVSRVVLEREIEVVE